MRPQGAPAPVNSPGSDAQRHGHHVEGTDLMNTIHADGHVATGFQKIADAFLANFTERGDTGAACTVYVHGRHRGRPLGR